MSNTTESHSNDMLLHPLDSRDRRPASLNNPFNYVPHPLCREAARQVCAYLKDHPEWSAEVEAGKMFGVLVCEDKDGRLGFLAAYSGQIGGREDWPWFVPAVFDYLQSDGYFKREEKEISDINRRVALLEHDRQFVELEERLREVTDEAQTAIDGYREEMRLSKQLRDAEREKGADEAALTRESQYQKAELRRLKARWKAAADAVSQQLKPWHEQRDGLLRERKQRSDALQRWLFDLFVMVNGEGKRRTLTDIFALTPQHTPPSGAGECCAPKLLQYAFLHHLRPLQIAEFWQGRSPRMEIRHHGQFYGACSGKCKPILEFQLGIDPPPTPPLREGSGYLTQQKDYILTPQKGYNPTPQKGYNPTPQKEDSPTPQRHKHIDYILPSLKGGAGGRSGGSGGSEWSGGSGGSCASTGTTASSFLVISKPSGLLSVPGRSGEPSVQSILEQQLGRPVYMVHRLDQDTSGLMVVALTREAYHSLQRQFLARTIYKMYVAVIEGVPHEQHGTIRLPLRPDLLDRPRQVVDREQGKEAVTDYTVISVDGEGRARLSLVPHTGRTHQLRVHCAHPDGLGLPIVGDRLYGITKEGEQEVSRLLLHAAELSFDDPASGRRLTFTSPAPF